MISYRDATVTGSQEASDAAGKRSEMAHQLAIMAKALKRDMEEALCQKGAKTTGNATTARVTGGFESWITSNDSKELLVLLQVAVLLLQRNSKSSN